MKFFVAVALFVVSCSAAPSGVPVDTPEVQLEKQIHADAHRRALAGQPANPILYHPQLAWNHAPAHNDWNQHNNWNHAPAHNTWAHSHAAHGYHVPTIINGVPDETPEVKAAKAFHLQKLSEAHSHSAHYAPSHWDNGHWDDGHYNHVDDGHYNHADDGHWAHSGHQAYHGPIHIPHIVNGVPEETPEVKAAKAFHLQKLSEAHSHSAHYGHY